MKGKHISIVIPTYNVRELVLNCVKSVIENTRYPDWNLYIVDDASTDGTYQALNTEFSASIPEKITLIRNTKSKGSNTTWNKGTRKALKEFGGTKKQHIMLLESDTLVRPGWLGTLNEIIETNENVGFVTYEELVGCYGPGVAEAKMAVPMICCLVNGRLIDEIGLFDERLFFFYGDTVFCHKTMLAGWKILVSPEKLVEHVPKGSKYQIGNLYTEIEPRDREVFHSMLPL